MSQKYLVRSNAPRGRVAVHVKKPVFGYRLRGRVEWDALSHSETELDRFDEDLLRYSRGT